MCRLSLSDRRRHPGNPEHDVLTRLIAGRMSEQDMRAVAEYVAGLH